MVSEDDWEADKPHQELDNGINASEYPHQHDVSATPNVHEMIWLT